MPQQAFTPISAAVLLTKWLDALEAAGSQRFPVDVKELALHVGSQLKWPDPVFKVEPANLATFEGGLFRIDGRGWALLYNEQLRSAGRIRFTQAHELGHFLLHRAAQERFECSQADMVHWGTEMRAMESEADAFASNLLLPLRQFRGAVGPAVDFDALAEASNTFGVSLTSAALRWISATEQSAILILARDGFMDWSVSSDKARANGAYFRTKGRVVELPEGTIAADPSISSCRDGRRVSLKTWFQHAHPDAVAQEMKLACDNYGYTLTLLTLSPGDKVWAPWITDE